MFAKLKVLIIFGGRSEEHEVSLQSAASVMEQLDSQQYEIISVGITKEGHWLAGIDPREALEKGFPENSPTAILIPDPTRRELLFWHENTITSQKLDLVFPILHGPYGEDGSVQGLLELAGIPYVGSGIATSSLAMDKVLCKDLLTRHRIPQVQYLSLLRQEWEQEHAKLADIIDKKLGYPCFVKPANLGSSVGISKVHDRRELYTGITHALKYDRKIIVEENIQGREIEVAVLGNNKPRASVPGEIVPSNEFYDYEAKYLKRDSRLLIPAELPLSTVKKLQETAIQAFRATDCAGLARVDFFVTENNDRIILNEINTIPGFTEISMYPKLWEASGISYPELLDHLVALALERHALKKHG